MHTPKLSVVTICRNSEATIERTIQSVLAQTYPHIEYIVIDGGSTDGTLAIVERYRDKIHTVISEPDRGVYDAMNKGIARATGEWIHLLNSDDHYVSNGVLAAVIPRLRADSTNYCVLLRERNGVVEGVCRFPYQGWKLYISAKLPHPAMIISREQYHITGPYDTGLRIAADHDFILRLLGLYSPNFIDVPLVAMDQGGLSAVNLALTYREFMQVTVRHGMPRLAAWCIYWLKRLRWRV